MLQNVFGLKWSDFSEFRELVMLMEELSISIYGHSGTSY